MICSFVNFELCDIILFGYQSATIHMINISSIHIQSMLAVSPSVFLHLPESSEKQHMSVLPEFQFMWNICSSMEKCQKQIGGFGYTWVWLVKFWISNWICLNCTRIHWTKRKGWTNGNVLTKQNLCITRIYALKLFACLKTIESWNPN